MEIERSLSRGMSTLASGMSIAFVLFTISLDVMLSNGDVGGSPYREQFGLRLGFALLTLASISSSYLAWRSHVSDRHRSAVAYSLGGLLPIIVLGTIVIFEPVDT